MIVRRRRFTSAMSILVVMGAVGFGRFGYTMILPVMQSELVLSNAQVGDLAAANMTGYLLLAVLGGLIAARIGARSVISVSLLLAAVSMALTGLAASYRWALAGRFLTGLGSGGANVPMMGLLAAWYAKDRRGLAAGIAVSGSSIGLLITGLLIPIILRRYGPAGWRVSWHLLALLTATIALAAAVVLRNRPVGGGAGRSPAAERVAREPGRRTVRAEARRRHSAGIARLLRAKHVWRLSGIYVAFGFSYVIYATFFARGLISAGFSDARAGRLWSGIGAASIASGFIWGTVSDRIGRRHALALIYGLQACSFLIFGVSLPGNDAVSVVGYYVSAVLFALTAWSIPAVMSAAAGDLIGAPLASAAFGVITLFFGVGQIAGPAVAGRLAERLGGYGPSFVLAGLVAGAGAVLSILLLPNRLAVAQGDE